MKRSHDTFLLLLLIIIGQAGVIIVNGIWLRVIANRLSEIIEIVKILLP